jgi:peptidoglycan/LPS O-acetylase OafA/YrhL
LVWPVVLLLVALIFKKRTSGFLLATLTLLTIFSFSSIFIIETTLTYFATQTRIWELGIGAIVAIMGARTWPKIAQWSAVLILIGSLFVVNSTDQVPGVIVLPALLATALLLNVTDKNLLRVLGNRVMHYLGDLSFVLYLWHWPVIELHRQLSFTELSVIDSISLFLITFALAVITHHLFENPIRYNRYLAGHPAVTVISGSSAIAFSVLATYLLVKG